MTKLFSALLIGCVLGASALPCFAQSFTKQGDGYGAEERREERQFNFNSRNANLFHGRGFIQGGRSSTGLNSFTKSMDNTASRMRRDYDRSENAAAHRNYVNAVANQADTGLQLQRSFNNTQRQAYESGGLYNQPGGFVAPAAYGNGIYRNYRRY